VRREQLRLVLRDERVAVRYLHEPAARAKITDYVRPFHDLRHSSITNAAAAAGTSPAALMARTGHSDFMTT
jgi:integrase